jgi:hypothetical protein
MRLIHLIKQQTQHFKPPLKKAEKPVTSRDRAIFLTVRYFTVDQAAIFWGTEAE